MIGTFRNVDLMETIILSKLISSIVCVIMYQFYNRKKIKTVNQNFVYNKDCPICFNILIVAIVAECKHAYCVDCLHTFSMKNNWNNVCPLCRQIIKNLKILENESIKFSVPMKKKLQSKIAEISKSPKPNSTNLVSSRTLYTFLSDDSVILLWIWTVINIDALLYYSYWLFSVHFQ